MKVILLADVKGLGKKDEIVEVAIGYGQNYLVPRKLAVVATDGNVNEAKEKKIALEARKAKELAAAKELAKALNGKNVVVKAKTGDNGKLFGAVTNMDIADALKEQYGYDIDKKKVEIKVPIKNTGRFDFVLRVYPNITADLTVDVVAL